MNAPKFRTPNELLFAAAGIFFAGAAIGSALTWLSGNATTRSDHKTDMPPLAASSQIEAPQSTGAQTPARAPSAPTYTSNPAPGTIPAAAVEPAPPKVKQVIGKQAPLAHFAIPATKPSHAEASMARTHKSQEAGKENIKQPSRPAEALQETMEQHVTFEKSGIVAIDNNSVRFNSGRTVSVGNNFPSGEKLLALDPNRSKIITDKRILVLTP